MLVVKASIKDSSLRSFTCHICRVGGTNGGAASPQEVAANLHVPGTAAWTGGVPRGVLVVWSWLLLCVLMWLAFTLLCGVVPFNEVRECDRKFGVRREVYPPPCVRGSTVYVWFSFGPGPRRVVFECWTSVRCVIWVGWLVSVIVYICVLGVMCVVLLVAGCVSLLSLSFV